MRCGGAHPCSISQKKIYAVETRSRVNPRDVYLNLDAYRAAMEKLYRLIWQIPRRRWVLTYTLGATGRRIGEVLLLTTRDVDFQNRAITWRILKKRDKNYYVTLPMSDRLEDVLRRYIVFNGITDALFPISKRQAQYDVKKAFNEVGLYGWRPHDLLRLETPRALLRTGNIELVRRWTQHSSYKELLEYARVVGLEIDKPLVPW